MTDSKQKILKQILNRLENLEDRVKKLESLKGEDAQFKRAKRVPENKRLINFDINARAFVKKYVKGMSYPKKFTLLIAYLSKGKISIEVSLRNVEKLWRRMTAKDLLKAKFNRSYSTKAKTQGWIKEGTKPGFYCLTSNWMNIFKSK